MSSIGASQLSNWRVVCRLNFYVRTCFTNLELPFTTKKNKKILLIISSVSYVF